MIDLAYRELVRAANSSPVSPSGRPAVSAAPPAAGGLSFRQCGWRHCTRRAVHRGLCDLHEAHLDGRGEL